MIFWYTILFVLLLIPISAYAQTPQTITIDLSSTSNPNDFPYGIECDADPTFCYISIHNQGILAQVNKSTKAVTIIQDSLETASGGKDFYALTTDGNGNLFVPERDNGEVKKYNIPSNTWTRIIVMEEVIHADVDYPTGYLINPNLIRVNEPTHGLHTYQFSSNSFGGIDFTNGFVWQGLNYNLDFDSFAESIGVNDVSFNGLVRIDPTSTGGTNGVTRFSIPGATDIRGVHADSFDGTTLWITSQADDTIYKFDTTLGTVLSTIPITAGSNPRGLSDDALFLYVALNKPAGGNSQILKIDKLSLTTEIIDTTAPNTNGGTFTTFIFGNFLLWSDQSNHIGVINLSNNNKFVFTTNNADSNHFMDSTNGEIWVAGQGSAVINTIDTSEIPDGDNGGGKGNIHLTRPTIGVSHVNNKQIVQNGFSFNGKDITVTDNFHTNFEKQQVKVGEINTVKATAFAPHGIKVMEFDFGIPIVGQSHNAEVKVEFWFDQQQNHIKTEVVQNENLIDKESVKLVFAGDTNCSFGFTAGSCFEVLASFVFLESPFNEVMAVHAIDHKLLDQTTYLNEGIEVTGDSLNPPAIELMANQKGQLVPVIRVDKFNNLWSDEHGILFTRNNFGTWIQVSPVTMPQILDPDKQVDKRIYSYWNEMILLEQAKAKLTFNSEEIQNPISGFFAYDFPEITQREKLLKELGWQ